MSQFSEFCRHNPLYCFSASSTKGKLYILLSTPSGNFWIHSRTYKYFGYTSRLGLVIYMGAQTNIYLIKHARHENS